MLRNASFTTYLHPAERMGLSVGGYYEGKDGFLQTQPTTKNKTTAKSEVADCVGHGNQPMWLN